ncbi:kinase-like domain-containing protein [Podospora fimiseda]|uniref:Kinase-like domain-containing protein n=1 Tax=Podospora fimiseda TaxID=252190 RepID=A0AAN7BEJ5_9PEZI|nr:kinase-like domain-containing protein [Podospora fimiseda]
MYDQFGHATWIVVVPVAEPIALPPAARHPKVEELSARLSTSSPGKNGSSQKFLSVDSIFPGPSQDTTSVQKEDSDSDIEPFDNGHNIIYDRSESLQAAEQAALRSLQNQDRGTSTEAKPSTQIQDPMLEIDSDFVFDIQPPNLRSRLLTARVENEQGQPFIPPSVIPELVTASTIKEELLAVKSYPKLAGISDLDGFSRRVEESTRKLFAVLALIGRVADIGIFVSAGVENHSLPLRIEDLKCLNFGSKDVDNLEPEDGFCLGRSLKHWHMPTFEDFFSTQWQVITLCLPRISSTTEINPIYHYELGDGDILPFLPDSSGHLKEPIQGGFAAVNRVLIHPDNNQPRGPKHCVVKRIARWKRKAFEPEATNLRVINQLGNNDRCDLRDFWKFKQELNHDRWMLEQALGLAKAVAQLHAYSLWHGDIKPQNILHFTDHEGSASKDKAGRLVLADFGLGRRHTTDRRPGRLAGTMTYRAPDAQKSGASEIWSLGCVFLEFAVWFLEGFQMGDEFAAARTQSITLSRRSMRTRAGTERAIWIKRLKENRHCPDLLLPFIEIVEHDMLVTDPANRIDAQSLSKKLEAILATLLDEPQKVDQEAQKTRIIQTDGHVRGLVSLKKFQIIHCQPGMSPFRRILDRSRSWVEKALDAKVDWWPLPAITPQLQETQVLLTWE